MKNRVFIPILAALALALATTGCSSEVPVDGPQPPEVKNKPITLGVEGLSPQTMSRAPLDEWENTPVSVAYKFAGIQTAFDRSLTVTIEDLEDENDGQHIKTGMEYPADDSPVSFRGYHPVAAPDENGVVKYDISKGDADVMLSNTASGSFNTPIDDKLVFEHQLSRITFRMRCAQNQSYPELVYGIRAGASSQQPLMTIASLDLDAQAPVAFSVPGSIFSGDTEGFSIPLYGMPHQVMEIMVQPGTPLNFKVVSLTSEKEINITYDPDGIWDALTTLGGEPGKRYTVVLTFSGEVILAQRITVDPWEEGDRDLGDNDGIIWW